MKWKSIYKYFIILKRGDIILLEFLEYGDQGDPTLGEVFFLRTNSEGYATPDFNSISLCDGGLCNYQSITKANLVVHQMSIHDAIKYSCIHCNYKATNKRES